MFLIIQNTIIVDLHKDLNTFSTTADFKKGTYYVCFQAYINWNITAWFTVQKNVLFTVPVFSLCLWQDVLALVSLREPTIEPTLF